jgi:hypothetical protein
LENKKIAESPKYGYRSQREPLPFLSRVALPKLQCSAKANRGWYKSNRAHWSGRTMCVRRKSGCCRRFRLKTNLKVIYAADGEEMLHEIREKCVGSSAKRERGDIFSHFFSFVEPSKMI